MKVLLIYLLIVIGINFQAQNLVPNYSFEVLDSCPKVSELFLAKPWCGLTGDEDVYYACGNPAFNTSVPYSAVHMFQYPHTGKGFTSLVLYVEPGPAANERNYAQVPLLQPLMAHKKYIVKYFINQNNDSQYCISDVDALLTTNPFQCNINSVYTFTTIIASPQIRNKTGVLLDTLNWIEVCDTMTAFGGEQYLILGNFNSNASTNVVKAYPTAFRVVNYTNIDDVYVEELKEADAKSDLTICLNDSIVIGNNTTESATYSWLPTTGLSCSFCPNPTASPTVTTKYMVTKQNCNIITKDSIIVTVKTICNTAPIEIPNVFTPNGDGINDTFYISLDPEFSNISFTVYNRWGLIVKELSEPTYHQINWDGRTTSGEPCSSGVYFYVLEYKNAKGDVQKKNGYISLFR